MASLIESYEQQYAVLTAEITSEIGKLKRSLAGKWDHRWPNWISFNKNIAILDNDKRDDINAITVSLDEVQELVSVSAYMLSQINKLLMNKKNNVQTVGANGLRDTWRWNEYESQSNISSKLLSCRTETIEARVSKC